MAATAFFSFHYTRDVARVQVVQKMNTLEGQPLLNSQDWERVRQRGPKGVQNWIDTQMSYKRTVVVLIGQETSTRPWVQYEVAKAWNEGRSLLGIRIHGISAWGKVDQPGPDPFTEVGIPKGVVPIFDPTHHGFLGGIDSKLTYANLRSNLSTWAASGVRNA